jgi:hypothetical protein
MKLAVLGVSRRHGTGRESGQKYDICELHYCREIRPRKTENYEFYGYGFTEGTLPCDPDCMKQFDGIAPGTEISVLLEPQPDNPQRNWVTGVA